MIPLHSYLNPRLWKDIIPEPIPEPIDTKEKAKKALKRDFDFSYDKENQLYEYKGKQVSEKRAIDYVMQNGLKDLKEHLELKGE